MSGLVSQFERRTFDDVRVIVEMVDGRGGAWIPQGRYLGATSTPVLSLFMGELCITDAADLDALLADCRKAKGSALALRSLRANRAKRAEAMARNAGRPRRRVEHSPRAMNVPVGCRCAGCMDPYGMRGWS